MYGALAFVMNPKVIPQMCESAIFLNEVSAAITFLICCSRLQKVKVISIKKDNENRTEQRSPYTMQQKGVRGILYKSYI